METIPLKEYVKKAGNQARLCRVFGITPGAMCQMVHSGRSVYVDVCDGSPLYLREVKMLRTAS